MTQESPLPSDIAGVLTELKVANPTLLGKGGEGYIFEFGHDKVLKIYPETSLDYLKKLRDSQKMIAGYGLPYATPQILEIGQTKDIFYTTEALLPGQPLDKLFSGLNEPQRQQVLKNFYEAMKAFNSVEFPNRPFGQILQLENSITANTWTEFLKRKFVQRVKKSQKWLEKDVTNFEMKVEEFPAIIAKELGSEEKRLVHGDYYFNNVLVGGDLGITSVLDFSAHAAAGDPKLDVASINFLTLDKNVQPNHIAYLIGLAEADYGPEIHKHIDLYGIYYAFYYADTYQFDRNSYGWSLGILNNESLWSKYVETK